MVDWTQDCEKWCATALPSLTTRGMISLAKLVIDSEVRIPDGLVVGEDPDLDAKRFRRTDEGVTLITRPMIERIRQQEV